MADTPRPNPPAEDDMHWGIAYLREDIQDLRLGLRVMHERMDRLAEASNSLIGGVNDNLSNRIDAGNKVLSDRIDSRFAVLLTAMIALIGISIGANFTFLQMYLPTH